MSDLDRTTDISSENERRPLKGQSELVRNLCRAQPHVSSRW